MASITNYTAPPPNPLRRDFAIASASEQSVFVRMCPNASNIQLGNMTMTPVFSATFSVKVGYISARQFGNNYFEFSLEYIDIMRPRLYQSFSELPDPALAVGSPLPVQMTYGPLEWLRYSGTLLRRMPTTPLLNGKAQTYVELVTEDVPNTITQGGVPERQLAIRPRGVPPAPKSIAPVWDNAKKTYRYNLGLSVRQNPTVREWQPGGETVAWAYEIKSGDTVYMTGTIRNNMVIKSRTPDGDICEVTSGAQTGMTGGNS